jgi:hypothetical protein
MCRIKFHNTKRVRGAVERKLGGRAPVQLPDDAPPPIPEAEAPTAPATVDDLPFPIVYDASKTTWASFKAQLATRPLGGLGPDTALWEEFLQRRLEFGLPVVDKFQIARARTILSSSSVCFAGLWVRRSSIYDTS